MLHDQEAVVVLLQDGHELEEGDGAAHFQFREVAVQSAEDAGVVATDEEDLVALQFQVAVQGAGQQLHGGDEDAVGLGEQGDGRVEKEGGPKKLFVVAWKWGVKHFRH